MSERLSVLRLPAVRQALLGQPAPQVVDIATEDRVYQRAVSGAWRRKKHAGVSKGREKFTFAKGGAGLTEELVQEAPGQ